MLIVGLLYVVATWAGLAGYAHWQGAALGAARFARNPHARLDALGIASPLPPAPATAGRTTSR